MQLKQLLIRSLIGIIGCLILAILIPSCAIKPEAWKAPQPPSLEGPLKLNNKLQASKKLNLDGWVGPEDIVFDQEGNLYCGVHKDEKDFSDGKILKVSPTGEVSIFYDAGSWVAGLHFDPEGHLLALSHREGLIRISPEKEVTILAAKDQKGRRFLIPNGLDLAKDGNIYFTNTSSKASYTIKEGRKLILELLPTGALYKYDPISNKVETLIDGLYFGNGVAISKDEDYLLVVETTKYRILKYWLKGEEKGKVEVLMDNLPGFPNGISIREDGSFWLGFTTIRSKQLDKIHHKIGMKKLVYGLPGFLQPKQERFGLVLQISGQGDILNALYDSNGDQVPEAGAVKEYDGHLYLGGDMVPYISKYKLETSSINDH